jgi:4-oxalocrotonate tautomerase
MVLSSFPSVNTKEEKERGQIMPIIRVEMWKGATKETKAKLAKAITEDVATIAKKQAKNIVVVFHDYEREDWSIGGELSSDIDWSKR